MHVVATAGHVDHGKSTLVRALTGMEPDRFAEEQRRGMTIDLGFAWTTLASGAELAFVDVPGHQRFIGTMLAGLGPAPAVVMVVAADEGWRAQSAEHLAAINALGLTHGLLVVTRSDLADPGPAIAQAHGELAASSLGDVPTVAVSGRTGAGLEDLRAGLQAVVAGFPAPVLDGRVRLWVDRSFTIRGAGTVVTGTLGEGTVTVGDRLQLGDRTLVVRGLQTLGAAVDTVGAVARVALNLRGIEAGEIGRGDALLTPGRWALTSSVDVRLDTHEATRELMLHIGSAALNVHVRALGEGLARLSLPEPLALRPGDRAILRDPGRQEIVSGVEVLDTDPPSLRRRGAAGRRAEQLAAGLTLLGEVERRGAVPAAHLELAGLLVEETPGVLIFDSWLVAQKTWDRWLSAITAAVDADVAAEPMSPGLTHEAARQLLTLPSRTLLVPLATAAGLKTVGGRLRRPGAVVSLGVAEAAIAGIEQRLTLEPFAAPDREELEQLGLGTRELAAAASAGRLLRLANDVVLLPDGPARAMRILATIAQPFTTSAARQALATSRRVVVPLLEHLDGRGWTRREDNVRFVRR